MLLIDPPSLAYGSLQQWQTFLDEMRDLDDPDAAHWVTLAQHAVAHKQKAQDSWRSLVQLADDFNPHHKPAGSPEGGQFASAGGSGAAAPKRQTQARATGETVKKLVATVPGAAEKIHLARRLLDRTVPTNAPVAKGGHQHADGNWTAQRHELHQQILSKLFTPEKVAAATPKPGEQPVLHLLGGSGGSGKGWFTSAKGTVDPNTAIYLNSDDFKMALPEYRGWNAANLHEESSHLNKVAERRTREAGLNAIVDGTMGNLAQVEKRIAAFKAAGYKVVGHFMQVTPETSAQRALQRFVRGSQERQLGRFVSPEMLLAHSAKDNFMAARHKMDDWEMYDNEGSAPKFVARRASHQQAD